MSDYRRVQTTLAVWQAIHEAHPLRVFWSFSDPTGTFAGGSGEMGRMETGYGVEGTDFPILEAYTTWRIGPDEKRQDETHEYWLCIAKEQP